MKLDMSKAYDKLEWSFLERVMRSFGFSEGWINRIMGCVTTIQYEVLFRGIGMGSIIPSCGLR